MSLDMLKNAGLKRVPLIRQSETAECGLACLAMIAGYHGFNTSLSILRRRYNTTLRGMTLKNVVETADKMGMSSRALKVPLDLVDQVKLPAIIHWNLNHFVVLKSVSKKDFVILDPATGVRRIPLEEASKSYTGIALEVQPTEKFQKQSDKTSMRIRDLWGNLSGLKRGLLQLVILSVFMQLYVLLSPFFLQTVIDEVLQKSNIDLLIVLAIGFGGFAVFHALAQVLRNFVVLYMGATLSFQVASNLFGHLMSLPIDYFEKRHIGDVMSRFTSITPIKKMLTEGIIGSLIDGLMAITTLVMMFIYSPLLAMISVGAWTSYFLVRMALYRRLREYEEAAITSKADENSKFMESVNRVTSLKLFGGEKDRQRLWQNLYANSIHYDVRAQKLETWFEAVSIGLQGLELVILVSIAAGMVIAAEFTVGMLFAFMAYRTNFSTKASALIERAVEFRMLNLHLERMADIVHTAPEDNDGSALQGTGEPITGKLELKNVSYRYSSNDPFVLKDASITVLPGESVAIVGETGCGKSTLLKIMATLFKPEGGSLLIDDKPVSHFGFTEYRQQIGVVMQEDGLLSGTLAENIAFFNSEPDLKQITEASRDAQILEDILQLPMQFDSLVGDMGAALSGGQKQRIAIARALYRKPKILFMDEGTSHLDVGTEAKVNETIAALGITRIIIAHRPETIRKADRVLLCKDHKLTEVFEQVSYGETVVNLTQETGAGAINNAAEAS